MADFKNLFSRIELLESVSPIKNIQADSPLFNYIFTKSDFSNSFTDIEKVDMESACDVCHMGSERVDLKQTINNDFSLIMASF